MDERVFPPTGRRHDYRPHVLPATGAEAAHSNESVPDLGDENHLWRSHGVIKMRVGRFLADVKLPTDGDAERLARRLADMLRAGEGFAEVPEDR